MAGAKNLIILCTDEMRGDCLSASGRNPDIRTPNLDRLAARGVNFRQHHTVFPKCVPARISMMTGRYCHTDGYRNIFQLMPADQPDLLGSMLSAGYQAVLFGNNHCWEHVWEASHRPPTLTAGQRGHIIADHSFTPPYAPIFERYKQRQGTEKAAGDPDPHRLGLAARAAFLEYGGRRRELFDEAWTEQAIAFLEHGRSADRPFFMMVNIGQPHPPYGVEEPWFSQYDRKAIARWPGSLPRGATLPFLAQREVRTDGELPEAIAREIQAAYFGAIGKVDYLMGRIIDTVDRQGLFANSVVMLISDHGDFAGQYGLIEKWDTVFSDCLTNVPMVLCDPELPAGKMIDALSDHTDLAPTLAELMGVAPPPGVHGRSLVPVIAGAAGRDAVFADGGHEESALRRVAGGESLGATDSGKQQTYRRYPDSMARAKMIRTATHKLIVRQRGGNELYDLRADPWEIDNRHADPTLHDVRSSLQQRLLEWCLQTDTDRPAQDRLGA